MAGVVLCCVTACAKGWLLLALVLLQVQWWHEHAPGPSPHPCCSDAATLHTWAGDWLTSTASPHDARLMHPHKAFALVTRTRVLAPILSLPPSPLPPSLCPPIPTVPCSPRSGRHD